MPTKKILTKRNVFLQLIILRPHPHFTVTSAKKSAKPSAFYTFENLQVRRSAFYHRPPGQATDTGRHTARPSVADSELTYYPV